MMQKNEFKIVDLCKSHIPQMVEIEKLCFSLPWSEQALWEELENIQAKYFICEKDGRVAGYVGSRIILDEIYITNVAVSPDFRRMGIAKELISNLISWAEEINASFITLEVRSLNAPARNLYTSMGFTITGLRPGYYELPDDDAVLMTYFLSGEDL